MVINSMTMISDSDTDGYSFTHATLDTQTAYASAWERNVHNKTMEAWYPYDVVYIIWWRFLRHMIQKAWYVNDSCILKVSYLNGIADKQKIWDHVNNGLIKCIYKALLTSAVGGIIL